MCEGCCLCAANKVVIWCSVPDAKSCTWSGTTKTCTEGVHVGGLFLHVTVQTSILGDTYLGFGLAQVKSINHCPGPLCYVCTQRTSRHCRLNRRVQHGNCCRGVGHKSQLAVNQYIAQKPRNIDNYRQCSADFSRDLIKAYCCELCMQFFGLMMLGQAPYKLSAIVWMEITSRLPCFRQRSACPLEHKMQLDVLVTKPKTAVQWSWWQRCTHASMIGKTAHRLQTPE